MWTCRGCREGLLPAPGAESTTDRILVCSGSFCKRTSQASSVNKRLKYHSNLAEVAFLPDKSCKSSRTSCDSCRTAHEETLAGMVGFEPTVHCTKNSCLTTWLHPSSEGRDTAKAGSVQAPFCKEMRLFLQAVFTQQIFRDFFFAFGVHDAVQCGVLAGVHRFNLRAFV